MPTWSLPSPDVPRHCTVWWSELALLAPAHLNVLDAHEHRRRGAFREGTDQQRFTLGAVLLRFAAGAALGIGPEDVVVQRACTTCDGQHGQPRVSRPAALRGPLRESQGELHVSVTHSGDLVAVATTRVGPVGIDIEVVRALEFKRLLERTNGPTETPPVSARQFLTTWTRKESLVKATGTGIITDLRALTVGPPAEPARLLAWHDGPPQARMHDLSDVTARGAVGCVSILTPDAVSFDERHARRLLADHPPA